MANTMHLTSKNMNYILPPMAITKSDHLTSKNMKTARPIRGRRRKVSSLLSSFFRSLLRCLALSSLLRIVRFAADICHTFGVGGPD